MIFFRSTVRALQSQIDDLKERLETSETERKALLNRLLERNHFEPIRQVTTEPPRQTLQVIAPFGVQPQDIDEPLRQSWIAEETEYLMVTSGWSEGQARAEAEKRFTERNLAIKLN